MPVSASELISAETICICVSSSFFTSHLPGGHPPAANLHLLGFNDCCCAAATLIHSIGASPRSGIERAEDRRNNRSWSQRSEGVESQRDSEWLTGLACEFGQGYYFSAPLPSEAALDFIARHYNPAAAQETT